MPTGTKKNAGLFSKKAENLKRLLLPWSYLRKKEQDNINLMAEVIFWKLELCRARAENIILRNAMQVAIDKAVGPPVQEIPHNESKVH